MDKDNELDRNRMARIPKAPKEKKAPRKMSEKMRAKKEEEKKLVSSDGDTLKEKWFKARRREMVGACQCGCGEPSQKKNDIWFRCSICHIFPKHLFKSVEYHPLNWVERKFWTGPTGSSACHTNMDERGMDHWPNFADWDDIKEKFFILAPLLTDEERATNFYSRLEKLVYAN